MDPDGTLDALSNLGLTNPLADQKLSPGTQQGGSASHPGAEAALSSLLSARPEGRSSEPCGPSDQTNVAERDPGTQQQNTPYK